MLPSLHLLYAQIGFAALLLALILLRPEIFRSLEGKVFGLAALFLIPAFALYGGVSEHVERSGTTSACLSCHAMSEYGTSLHAKTEDSTSLAATHFENHLIPPERACVSCHTTYGLSGDLRSTARGARYALKAYFGAAPEKIRLSSRYRNRDCLKCHAGASSFERAEAHGVPGVSTASMKTGKTSCLKSGCHKMVHHTHEVAAAPSPTSSPSIAPDAAPEDSAAAIPWNPAFHGPQWGGS